MKNTTSTLEYNGKYFPEMETAEVTQTEAKSNKHPEAQNEDLSRQTSECIFHHNLQGTSLNAINEDIALKGLFEEEQKAKAETEVQAKEVAKTEVKKKEPSSKIPIIQILRNAIKVDKNNLEPLIKKAKEDVKSVVYCQVNTPA